MDRPATSGGKEASGPDGRTVVQVFEGVRFRGSITGMATARLVLAGLLLLLAAYIAAMNWGCVIVSVRNQRKGIDRHHSTIPLVTVLLAGIACPIWPYGSRWWAFAIPLADIANWLMLWLPVAVLRERREGSRETEHGIAKRR